MPKKKNLSLTLKQRKLIRNIAKGTSLARAAMEAGYAKASTRSSIYRMVADGSNLSEAIELLMDEAGLTDVKLLARLSEGVDALRNGQPDHTTRYRFLELALKLRGLLSPTEFKVEGKFTAKREDEMSDEELEMIARGGLVIRQ